MKTTTNYGFKQPEGTDIVNIDDISDNFGSVDTEIKKVNDKVVAHEGKGGSVHADATTTTSGFMSATDKTKLNGIATGAQTNQNAVQSIQVVTPTGNVVGTATAANTTDTIQLKEGNNIDIAVSGKVLTVNNTYSYTHPTGDGSLHVPTTGTSNSGKVLKAGATAGSLVWGTLTPTDVGALPTSHEGQGGTVHADVTTTVSGFMSAADKTKLNGIADGAQINQNAIQSIQVIAPNGTVLGTTTASNATDTIQLRAGNNIDIGVSGKVLTVYNAYSHPASDGSLHVPATGTTNSGKVLKAGSTAGSLAWGTLTSTDVGALPTSHQGQGGSVHADVTTSASGFMSASDKTKLNGIAAGAQINQNAVQSIQAVTSSGVAIGTATAASATDTIQVKEGSNIDITINGKTLTIDNLIYPLTNSDGTAKAADTTNFDTMSTAGQYRINGTCDNNPRQSPMARGVLEVKVVDANTIIQEFTYDPQWITNGSCNYVRSRYGGTWSSWVEAFSTNSYIQKYPLTQDSGLPISTGFTDFNYYVDTGIYGISVASGMSNPPTAGAMYGVLQVHKRIGAGAYEGLIQTYYNFNNHTVWTRFKHSGNWGDWRRLTTEDEFGSLRSSIGYQKLPGGLILQWGAVISTGYSSGQVFFPIAFPNSTFQIIASLHRGDGNLQVVNTAPQANTAFAWYSNSNLSSGVGVRWIAIGW